MGEKVKAVTLAAETQQLWLVSQEVSQRPQGVSTSPCPPESKPGTQHIKSPDLPYRPKKKKQIKAHMHTQNKQKQRTMTVSEYDKTYDSCNYESSVRETHTGP